MELAAKAAELKATQVLAPPPPTCLHPSITMLHSTTQVLAPLPSTSLHPSITMLHPTTQIALKMMEPPEPGRVTLNASRRLHEAAPYPSLHSGIPPPLTVVYPLPGQAAARGGADGGAGEG